MGAKLGTSSAEVRLVCYWLPKCIGHVMVMVMVMVMVKALALVVSRNGSKLGGGGRGTRNSNTK